MNYKPYLKFVSSADKLIESLKQKESKQDFTMVLSDPMEGLNALSDYFGKMKYKCDELSEK